jgi:hypothetical protein
MTLFPTSSPYPYFANILQIAIYVAQERQRYVPFSKLTSHCYYFENCFWWGITKYGGHFVTVAYFAGERRRSNSTHFLVQGVTHKSCQERRDGPTAGRTTASSNRTHKVLSWQSDQRTAVCKAQPVLDDAFPAINRWHLQLMCSWPKDFTT